MDGCRCCSGWLKGCRCCGGQVIKRGNLMPVCLSWCFCKLDLCWKDLPQI